MTNFLKCLVFLEQPAAGQLRECASLMESRDTGTPGTDAFLYMWITSPRGLFHKAIPITEAIKIPEAGAAVKEKDQLQRLPTRDEKNI